MPDDQKTTVIFGNEAPVMQERRPTIEIIDGEPKVTGYEQVAIPALHLKQTETVVRMREDFDDPEHVDLTLSTDNDRFLAMIANSLPAEDRIYAVGLSELEQVVREHYHGNSMPSYVWSDDEHFAQVIGKHFNNIPVGRPTGLITNAGKDAIHNQHFNSGSQPAAFTFMALSTSVAGENATNTTLPSEITTSGGGLVRRSATFAHTVGTNTSTLTTTFTANSSDTFPTVAGKAGVFNASSAGTLGYEKNLTSTYTFSASGDNLTLTFTDTIG